MSNQCYSCFVCDGKESRVSSNDYLACSQCGHEVLVSTREQGFIINDHLSVGEVNKLTALDHFKQRVLLKADRRISRNHLLDIGSASGKFCYINLKRYERVTGIEVTKESLDFSRNILSLNIVESIEGVVGPVSLVTAWHSLEHIPADRMLNLFEVLASEMLPGSKVIISVPNADSYQYDFFKTAYAYYDVPNHLHQFTPESLDFLMKKFKFKPVKMFNSWTYNSFGWTQGLLNILTGTHNYLYYRIKRKSQKPMLMLDIICGFLLVVCIPIGWIFASLEILNKRKQGVITACYQKNS